MQISIFLKLLEQVKKSEKLTKNIYFEPILCLDFFASQIKYLTLSLLLRLKNLFYSCFVTIKMFYRIFVGVYIITASSASFSASSACSAWTYFNVWFWARIEKVLFFFSTKQQAATFDEAEKRITMKNFYRWMKEHLHTFFYHLKNEWLLRFMR